VSPLNTVIQLTRTPKKAKPIAAARPSAAERGSGVSPDCDPQLAQAPKKPIAATTPSAANRGRLLTATLA
jgi:hypothetical protein